MFNNISWQSYWLFLALTLGFYYLFIYLLFFHRSIKAYLHRRYQNSFDAYPSAIPGNSENTGVSLGQPSLFDDLSDSANPSKDNAENMVYACMDELTAYFEEAKREKCVRSEVINAIRSILYKYPSIGSSEYKASLTNLMAAQCENICSIHLSADDLASVWMIR